MSGLEVESVEEVKPTVAVLDIPGTATWLKDFFDVYTILKADKVDDALLKEAVAEVFANRGTEMDADNVVFSDGFAQDGMRQTMWKAYLKKIKYKDELPFTEVMDVVRERLQPMMLGEVEDEA